jgi:2-oxoglutarate ferredoxin oxidoreductase subunit alpha
MYDFVPLAYELAFKYRNPAMILTDGIIGQVMERVEVEDYKPRWTNEYIAENYPWTTLGKPADRKRNVVTSLELESARQEQVNHRIQAKYRECEAHEVRYEALHCDDAEYIFVAYGSSARICQKAIELARAKGIKVGLLRPITLWPFPSEALAKLPAKAFVAAEMSMGQMKVDVELAIRCSRPVALCSRVGGVVPTPEDITATVKEVMACL